MNFTSWLNSTLDLQRTAYDVDPPYLDPEERAEFIRWNVLAATDELHEALGEVGWKPWATDRYFNRDAFVGELIDVMHFVANLLVTAGVTGDELSQRYHSKQRRNAYRQEVGYDGKTGKCPTCRRDLEDLKTGPLSYLAFEKVDGVTYCSKTCATAAADC